MNTITKSLEGVSNSLMWKIEKFFNGENGPLAEKVFSGEWTERLLNVKRGEPILFVEDKILTLIRLKSFNYDILERGDAYIGRAKVLCFPETFFLQMQRFEAERNGDKNDKLQIEKKLEEAREREMEYRARTPDERLVISTEASHLIECRWNEMYQTYIPSSTDSRYVADIAMKKDGVVSENKNLPQFFTNKNEIIEKLSERISPLYVKQVIIPFLLEKPTGLVAPSWKKHPGNQFMCANWLWKRLPDLKHGEFVYLGSKNQVSLLCPALDEGEDFFYMQGTYITSTRPVLLFANTCLGFSGFHEVKNERDMPGFMGKDVSGVAPLWHPFIFPMISEGQNCKIAIFNGEPEVVTTNIVDALYHFAKTPFAPWREMLRKYYQMRNIPIKPDERRGKYFY